MLSVRPVRVQSMWLLHGLQPMAPSAAALS